jgi:hypothetical protein
MSAGGIVAHVSLSIVLMLSIAGVLRLPGADDIELVNRFHPRSTLSPM